MPRFVVLSHETPADSERGNHFDLMFECESSLLTWAVEQLPAKGRELPAERLPDHRLLYLDYEGPVSGERGRVRRIDAGDFDWIAQQSKRYEAQLHGDKLRGRLVIAEMDGDAQRWRVAFSD